MSKVDGNPGHLWGVDARLWGFTGLATPFITIYCLSLACSGKRGSKSVWSTPAEGLESLRREEDVAVSAMGQ